MCRGTMVLLKSKWLRQPKNDSQKSSLVWIKDLFLDTSGKEISHAKYQPPSEELKDVAAVILWNKGDSQSLFIFKCIFWTNIKTMVYSVHQWFLDISVYLGRQRILACQWIFQLVGSGLLQILCDNQIISSCCQQKWQISIYKRSLTWIWSLVRFFSTSCKRELDVNSPSEINVCHWQTSIWRNQDISYKTANFY